MSLKTLELITPRAALTPGILDDDPSQLELMTELVASAGFEAVATADPEEALQLVRSGRSRLILVDVHMPGMNRYEFLERAIKADRGAHVILWVRSGIDCAGQSGGRVSGTRCDAGKITARVLTCWERRNRSEIPRPPEADSG